MEDFSGSSEAGKAAVVADWDSSACSDFCSPDVSSERALSASCSRFSGRS